MTHGVFTKWLWDSRRSLVGWSVAIVFAGGGYAAFWPTVNNPELQDFIDSYPEAVLKAINYTDIATSAGYLNATVYGLVVAVLMLVYAVGAGTQTIAGDEAAGTLELVMAHPVSRVSVAVQRFGAFACSVLILVGVFWVVMLAIRGPAQLSGISVAGLAAMHVHLAAFAILFGALTFAVGASTGRRSLALAVGAGAGVLAYAASGIVPQVQGLAWVRDYSPFFWLNGSHPLDNGLHWGHVGFMLGLSLGLVALGTAAFQHRDLAT